MLEAGHKRARPIVMTTVAMVAGMLPVAIGWGGDSEFRAPMAIAVIGGLLTSTVLTLVIVPAVFTLSTTSSAGWRRSSAACSPRSLSRRRPAAAANHLGAMLDRGLAARGS